ncbi:hypothetical protein SLS62_007528 [Diatrype stigma]|uniref:Uncharacterized protein n=1 Tax=Diatrype stigma TaxID=117547 RepID=A0AAN9UPK9_9PEZI
MVMILSVERSDNTRPLAYCKDAFNNILDQCITNGNYWGGTWTLDGETYNISNSVYPNNGISPTDEGGVDTGPITEGPGSSTTTPTFSTTTATIAGLTTNSATTTSVDGQSTILPIWFVSAGVGIILVPGAGVAPGVVIPPPSGYPPLVIGSDGQVHEEDSDNNDNDNDDDGDDEECSACSSCAGFEVLDADATDTLENDGDPDLPTIDPSIWATMETKYPLTTIPTTTPLSGYGVT